jgi:hypothetical protein
MTLLTRLSANVLPPPHSCITSAYNAVQKVNENRDHMGDGVQLLFIQLLLIAGFYFINEVIGNQMENIQH